MKAKKFAKIGKKLALDSLIDGLNTFYNIPIDSFGLYNIQWSFSMENAEVEKVASYHLAGITIQDDIYYGVTVTYTRGNGKIITTGAERLGSNEDEAYKYLNGINNNISLDN